MGVFSFSFLWLETVTIYLTFALAAHLLQQVVDERASEHVENIGSNPSFDP